MRLFIAVALLIITFSIIDCSSSRLSLQNRNVAMLYNPASTNLHPEFFVYHFNDTSTQVYFRIYTDELLFNKSNMEGEDKAKVRIKYLLFSYGEENKLTDSSSVTYDIVKKTAGKEYVAFFTIKINSGSYLSMELITTDLLRNSSHLKFITVDKKSFFSRQNFLITVNSKTTPVFNSYLTSNDTVFIKNERAMPASYNVKYYKEYSLSPLPAFSLTPFRPHEFRSDSTWKMNTDGGILKFCAKYRGIYHLLADTSGTIGLTLFNMGEFYPLVRTTSEMIKPIRYITTAKEYKNLTSAKDEKAAVDSFWLKSSGNINRAKELIRVYYSRVNFSNIYFTSYIPGWLSDRGMVYVVFGPPKTIYKDYDNERWIYGDNSNLMSMDFYFQKIDSEFSDNYFVLKRGEVYKSSWYQATDTWRNGRIYSVLN